MAGGSLEAKMRKVLASLALGGVMLAALSVAAQACDYYNKTNAANESQQTAQAQPPADASHN
jgi:hypothetical protein